MFGGLKMRKQKFYRIDNIEKTEAQYRILLGERSNGKSYAVKEKCLLNAYHDNKRFGYLRRYQSDVKQSDVDAYFADMPVSSITDGEYTLMSTYRGRIYFAVMTDDFKIIRGKLAGYVFYLSGLEHFKSQSFNDVFDIVYEEFITAKMYLDNEPDMLQQFVSTIARRRKIVVWLIGNTINRICPYFQKWQLKNVVKQKQGTIELYRFNTKQQDEDGCPVIVTIAVEFCENSGNNSKMFFGSIENNIANGYWETEEKPHLPGDIRKFEKLYEFLLTDMGFSFVVQLLAEADGGLFVYVYPYTYKRKIDRKICSNFSHNIFTSFRLYDTIKVEKLMRDLISQKKICYSDNLTGTDFEQVLLNRGGV